MLLKKTLLAFLLCTTLTQYGEMAMWTGQSTEYASRKLTYGSLKKCVIQRRPAVSILRDAASLRSAAPQDDTAGHLEGCFAEFAYSNVFRSTRLVVENASALIIPEKAFAQAIGGSNPSGAMTSRFLTKSLEVLVVINWIALSAVEALLDPDMIFGRIMNPAGDRAIEPILRNIWVTSRNIANGIFGLMLLLGGVMIILTGKKETVLQRAPNFVLAVILVNFSWFFPRVIIDVSHVLSAVIYQLPFLVDPTIDTDNKCWYHPGNDNDPSTLDADGSQVHCLYVWKVYLFPPDSCPPPGTTPMPNGCPRPTKTGTAPYRGVQIANFADIYYQDWKDARRDGQCNPSSVPPSAACTNANRIPLSGANSIINGLATNFARLPGMGTIDFSQLLVGIGIAPNPLQTARLLMRFTINLVFLVIFSLAITFTLVAFAVVLIVRMGFLWFTISFMPLMFVPFAWGHKWGEMPGDITFNLWKKFIAYALLPVFVAIPYAVGFTLLSQLYFYNGININLGIVNAPLPSGLNDLQHLIWLFLTIGVLWVGVFEALKKDEYSAGIVGSIKGFGQGLMKTAGFGAIGFPGAPLPASTGSGTQKATFGSLLGKGRNLFGSVRDKGLGLNSGSGVVSPADISSIVNKINSTPALTAALPGALRNIGKTTTKEAAKDSLKDLRLLLERNNIQPRQAASITNRPGDFRSFLTELENRRVVTGSEAKQIRNNEHVQNALGGAPGDAVSMRRAGLIDFRVPQSGGIAEGRNNALLAATNAIKSGSHDLKRAIDALTRGRDELLPHQILPRRGADEVIVKLQSLPDNASQAEILKTLKEMGQQDTNTPSQNTENIV